MSQITLYLDDELQDVIAQAAQAQGVSKSRWVAQLIRNYAAHQWPQQCLELAGQFPDFPLQDEGACRVACRVAMCHGWVLRVRCAGSR